MNLTIQWHITEQCNWRCTHCYHDGYLDKGPDLNTLKRIFDQIINIKEGHFGKINRIKINFAGGEPLIRHDFIDLLKYINSKVKFMKIGILTNGSLIDKIFFNKIKKLSNLEISFQVSLEGTREINDSIRGKRAFDKIIRAIKLCKKEGFFIRLSFTLTNKNKNEIIKLIPFVKKYKIRLYVRRFVPMGQTKKEYNLILSSIEWYKLSIKIYNINNTIFKNTKKLGFFLSGCSEITGYKYKGKGCAINEQRILIIMHNQDILSCRRLPIILGNLKKESLNNIYMGRGYLKQINSSNNINICKKCPYFNWCKGGAKCITYAKEKTLDKEDPQCYFAEEIEKNIK